ncbi:hypothetical protein Clacol_001901 [Clathrus columnatus]|uniref:Alpha/beta hydrolase fold-3 domain-containing protein n=1 Tax=Clathrus columnatus TaxID=1419009 RepID=A0AAV4ZZB4_9AGAM|nr:hypothetical protein Clacol_001901 [Clathrus columnatus]
MSSALEVDPNHNALLPEFEARLEPHYVTLYNKHIRGRKLAHEFTVEENRSNPVILSFGIEPGPVVGKVERLNITVSDGAEIPLVIYRPTEEQAKISAEGGGLPPVHINVHGGGWVLGGIADDDSWIKNAVAVTGCVAISVGYRLAPEHRLPTGINDVWDTLVYVAQNSADLGIDQTRISIGGFSAGGHIAAVLSHRSRDRGLPNNGKLVFALMVIPVTDANALDTDLQVRNDTPYSSWKECYYGPFLSYARMSWFYKYALPLPITESVLLDPEISPIHSKNFKGLPPTLVYPAEIDVLREEGLAYAKKLQDEGDGWVECVVAKGVPHPFPHQTAATPRAKELVTKSTTRLREAYAGLLKRS